MAALTTILALVAIVHALPPVNLTTHSYFPATNNLTARGVNPLFTSDSNPDVDSYPTQLQLIVTALREDLRRIRIYIIDKEYGCDFNLNCDDLDYHTAGPDQTIGWATYYLPCLGYEPLEVHHGEYCQEKGVMGYQFDNLWFRYADQFINVPDDCPRDQKKYATSPPWDCFGESADFWIPWPIPERRNPYRHTCRFGSYKTVEEIAEAMEHPQPPRGTKFGRPYCESKTRPTEDGMIPNGKGG